MDLEDQYDKLYRYCYFRVRDVQTAEDLVQETFLRWLDHYPGQREREALPTLYTIARNLCVDVTRQRETLLPLCITAVPGKMCGLNGIFLFFTKKAPLKQGGGTRGQLSQF